MNDLINICGTKVDRILYKGQPVITFRMIDELHQRPEGTARRTFNQHKDRFEEGYHFFEVPYEEWSQIPAVRNSSGGPDTGQRNPIKLFTQIGYVLLVKPFSDDLAWDVQVALVREYFTLKESLLNFNKKMGSSRKQDELPYVKISNEFMGILKVASAIGHTPPHAKINANNLIMEKYGVDLIDKLNATNIIQDHVHAEFMDAQSGYSLVNAVMAVSGDIIKPKDPRFSTIEDVLVDTISNTLYRGTLENLGLKWIEPGSVLFIAPPLMEKNLIPKMPGWEGCVIREFLLTIPNSSSAQVRMAGTPVRGVKFPWPFQQPLPVLTV